MRYILVDWLKNVAEKFKFRIETFFLTVFFLDKISKKILTRKNYQLFGVACLSVASKFEEINPLKFKHLVYISD